MPVKNFGITSVLMIAVKKTDHLTKGKQLTKIMNQVSNAADKLNYYIAQLEKHKRY